MNLVFDIGTIDIAVCDSERAYVENNFPEYKNIGWEIIVVEDLDTHKRLKIKVYVYKVGIRRAFAKIPNGFWIRGNNIWKRTEN
jgi:hypothetical protein